MSSYSTIEQTMVRRTVSLPDDLDTRVRDNAIEGESFSAAVARLLEAGLRSVAAVVPPAYVGSGEGPEDLGINAEKYLRELSFD